VDVPEVRYAFTSDDTRIAYQDFGEGPPVVFAFAPFTHLLGLWDVDLVRQRLLERPALSQRVLLFDQRGAGLSDGFDTPPSLDDRASDIEAVLDAAGVERTSLRGFDFGAQVAIAFAARNPERVDRIALVNARVGPVGDERANELNPDIDVHESASAASRLEQVRTSVGREESDHLWVETSPSALRYPEYIAARTEYERLVGSRDVWRRQIESIADIDIVDVAPLVQAPTLITNNQNRIHHLGKARLLRELIPDATLVEFDGDDAEYWLGSNWAEIEDAHIRFLTGREPRLPATKRLAVVMFTDLVGSTATSLSVGDAAWKERLERYELAAQKASAENQGEIVKQTGDGHLMVFDRPDHAIRAALRLRDRMRELGSALRIGIHAGLVEARGDDISGAVVNVASRVEQAAGTNQVFVTSTIREMLIGTSAEFDNAGPHDLRGFEEPWTLYSVDAGP
jgi:class 3 adenylate cyclase/alpha/beta superfamily hydrolase